jgi:SAM-dependent methyltransferase
VRHTRYDRVATSYTQYRPRYPDALIDDLAGRIREASGAGMVLDLGSGTGAFARLLRAALPSGLRIFGVEPSRAMLSQAVAETSGSADPLLVAGTAEAMPFRNNAAVAIAAATAAHWFDRPAFYREARRVLSPGGVLAIAEYARDETDPLAAALVSFMKRHGSPRAYAPPDYRRELGALDGFGEVNEFVLPRRLELRVEDFVGLALSSSHAAGLVERFGGEGAREALRSLAASYRSDDDHVLFGYRFSCLTARRAG